MKSFRFWVSSMLLASLFLSCSCRQEDKIPIPQTLKINTYGMLEEAMDIQVTGPEGLEVEIDFGDGTTAVATTNNVVTHAYSTPGDYTLSASGDGLSVTNKVRIYGLVAISALMEDITAPGYDYILNMSHRGNCSDKSIPENSIPALKNCISKGIEFIEIDTHITSDGIVVVCHDETVDRTTDGTGSIPDMTYAEIQKLHLRDRNGNVTEEKMPTLEEILKAGDKPLEITLVKENTILDEVIVVGYGTLTKKEMTSAISHIGADDLNNISSIDASDKVNQERHDRLSGMPLPLY